MKKFYIIAAAVAVLTAGAIGLWTFLRTYSDKAESVTANNGDLPGGGTVSSSVYATIVPASNIDVQPQLEKKEEILKIVAVGDILLGRGVGSRVKKENRDFTYPFLEVADILKKGDVVFGNLEEPITSSTRSLTGIRQGGKYVLKNDIEAMDGIIYAGFNLFSLANNHILDYYEQGLFDTMAILDKHGIAYSGAGKNMEEARKPAIIEKKGLKIGLLSYTDMAEVVYKGNPPLKFIAGKDKTGVAPRPIEFNDFIKTDINKLRDKVDILIVSLHWGQEDSFDVLSSQKEFAHKLIDNGVDIILGHHPHQFQGIEIYNGKPIFYSLGNFIFDQNDPENQESFIITMNYKDKKLTSIEGIPVRTIDKKQVVPQKGEGAKAILERELNLCKELGTEFYIKDDRLYFELE
ncbi:MAG: CapA family protein [Bacillota bacterium]